MATIDTTNLAQIAWQLERTAMGDGYYGEALRAALALPSISDADRALLARYTAGAQAGTDHVELQWLAIGISTTQTARTD